VLKHLRAVVTGVVLAIFSTGAYAQDAAALQSLYDDEQNRPPNIVLILFDWARRDAIGVYSDKDVSTPNIDQLAADGVRFDNAYTTAVLCSPARASILTGTYPHTHGIRKTMYPSGINGGLPTMYLEPISNPFNDDRFKLATNFPKYLTNSGFATAHIGKWHLGTVNPGFFDLFKSYNSLMPHWIGEPNASAYREDVYTNEGVRFIQQNADRPFFLYQSYYNPHAPNQPPQRFVDQYEDRDIDHKNYYASVTSLDENVGKIVQALKDQGVFDNTLIIVSADHAGSFQTRPGSLRGMGMAFDEAARVPMIMHWPDRLPKDVVWQSGVSLVDLAPTLLAATGINTKSRIMEIITGRVGSPFHGRDLISEVNSGEDSWPVPIFIQNVPEAAIDGSWFDERAMRTEKWKLVLRDFTADPRVRNNAFYNIQSDPGETTNLYGNKEHRKVLLEQLEIMLATATNLRDDLTIEMASKELEIMSQAGDYEFKLYD
jgi:arylsulfatase A-like enzyme